MRWTSVNINNRSRRREVLGGAGCNPLVLTLMALLAAPFVAAAPAHAQRMQAAPPPNALPANANMQSILYEAVQAAGRPGLAPADARRELANRGIELENVGPMGNPMMHVEIIWPNDPEPVDERVLDRFGAVTSSTWTNRVDAWVEPTKLIALASALPPGSFITRADMGTADEVLGQGPYVTNSLTYRNGGADGTGVTIGVIDIGYANLTAARSAGDAPALAATSFVNLTPTSIENPGSGNHGTAVVEAAFDHAPGATYRLYKTDSLTDTGAAVEDAIANGVDVIIHAISRYNTGWADDTGAACQAVTQACNAGIIFVTSAGNRAQQHWEGMFSDSDGNRWHSWNGAGGDEALAISVPAFGFITCHLQWSPAGGPHNYDLYLYNSSLSTVLGSSTNPGTLPEEFTWTNASPSAAIVNLEVRRVSGGATMMEIFTQLTAVWQEHIVSAGSTTSPSNTTHPLCVSIGAVDWPLYSLTAGGAAAFSYSGRGPSNSGMLLPDLTSPTNTVGFTYPFGFDGTSAASANAGGAVAAFLSGNASVASDPARYLIYRQAGIFRDWGAPGADNDHGQGGLYFHGYLAGTAWVDRSVGSPPAAPTQPFYFVQDAVNWAPAGGRLVFLGQNYPEPVNADKNLRLETIGGTALIGQ